MYVVYINGISVPTHYSLIWWETPDVQSDMLRISLYFLNAGKGISPGEADGVQVTQ